MTPTRRAFAFVPSTIALIVTLLASSAGIAVSFARAQATPAATQAPTHARVDRADGRGTEPNEPARTLFLHTQATATGRIHAPYTTGGDGARGAVALRAERATLAPGALRAPGAAVDARRDGLPSPGQPAPSSRAPPIG